MWYTNDNDDSLSSICNVHVAGYAVALMVPILTIIDVYAAYLHRAALDWSSVWILLPPSFCGMGLGMVLDGHLSDAGAR